MPTDNNQSSIIDEIEKFLDYCKEERNKFVVQFWKSHKDDIELRVKAENLLISFDQLMNRIREQINKHNESNKEN